MKKDVMISIKGITKYDEETQDVTELYVKGNLFYKGNSYFLTYNETEATGFGGAKTTLKIDKQNRVVMQRSGLNASNLVVENGKRHQCLYNTGYGELMIGVMGNHVESTLDENGGNLEFKYSIDINTTMTTQNEIYIKVK